MKSLNISKRDIRIFFLGMFIMFLILLIYDWRDFMKGITDGYNDIVTEQVNK